MLKLVLLLCSLTYVVVCQDCQTTLTTCLTNAKQAHDAKVAAMKTNYDACFTNNNCVVPTMNSTNNVSTYAANNKINVTAIQESIAKFKGCVQQVKPSIEACVSTNTSTTFTFPQMTNEGEQHQGFQGHPGFQHGQGGNHGNFLSTACNGNNASITAVEQCLKGLMENHTDSKSGKGRGHKGSFGGHNQKDMFCEVRNNCTQNLTADCQTQLKKIKTAICTCARSNVTEQSFLTCMGFNGTQFPRHQRNAHNNNNQGGRDAGRGHNQGSYGQQHNMGSGFEQHHMTGLSMFCDDHCDQQSQNGNRHGIHHEGPSDFGNENGGYGGQNGGRGGQNGGREGQNGGREGQNGGREGQNGGREGQNGGRGGQNGGRGGQNGGRGGQNGGRGGQNGGREGQNGGFGGSSDNGGYNSNSRNMGDFGGSSNRGGNQNNGYEGQNGRGNGW